MPRGACANRIVGAGRDFSDAIGPSENGQPWTTAGVRYEELSITTSGRLSLSTPKAT